MLLQEQRKEVPAKVRWRVLPRAWYMQSAGMSRKLIASESRKVGNPGERHEAVEL